MITDDDITAFVEQLRARLRVGAQDYGNTSFERPIAEIVGEIEQELLDVAGWGLIAWVRMRRARGAAEQGIHQGGHRNG